MNSNLDRLIKEVLNESQLLNETYYCWHHSGAYPNGNAKCSRHVCGAAGYHHHNTVPTDVYSKPSWDSYFGCTASVGPPGGGDPTSVDGDFVHEPEEFENPNLGGGLDRGKMIREKWGDGADTDGCESCYSIGQFCCHGSCSITPCEGSKTRGDDSNVDEELNEQDSPANPCEGSNICCVNREKTEMMEPVFDRYDEETGEYICKCPVGSRKVPCGGQDINESDLRRIIHRVINEDSEPKYCCNPECTTCSKDCSRGGVCGDMSAHSGMSVSNRSDFMDEPHIGESDLRRLVKRVINEDVSCKCMQMLITRYLNADGSCCEREEVSYSFVDCPCSGAGSGADAGAGPLTHPHAETAGRGKARELPPKIVNVEKNQYRIKDDGTPERIMS